MPLPDDVCSMVRQGNDSSDTLLWDCQSKLTLRSPSTFTHGMHEFIGDYLYF